MCVLFAARATLFVEPQVRMSILQIPYREGRDGFWGEQTSTLNWCEEVPKLHHLQPALTRETHHESDIGLQHHILLRRAGQHIDQLDVYVARSQGVTQCP